MSDTQTLQDTLSAALHILAGDVCLYASRDYIARCRKFSDLHATGMIEGAIDSMIDCTIDAASLSTWLCDGAHFFTLFRPNSAVGTLLFSHTNEVLYHASVDAQLSVECPADVSFLCQFTFDRMPEGNTPRLLAFDVMGDAVGGSISSITSPACSNITSRGDRLRSMQAHLPQALCVVQWIGPRRYLSPEFLAALPHAVKGLIALGEDPLVPAAFEPL
jgi:hypothetical protein